MSSPSRRSHGVLAADAHDLAASALGEAVGSVVAGMPDAPYDFVVDIDGHTIAVEVKAVAYATVERIEALKRREPPTGQAVVLLVTSRINEPARRKLRDEGWAYLDAASGELHVRAPGVRVDTTVEAVSAGSARKPAGVVGRAGRAVAYEILRRQFDGDLRPITPTRAGVEFGVARSSASDAMRALAAAGLVADNGAPVLPVLFWELAKAWAPADRRWLAAAPDPADWNTLHDPTRGAWRLGGAEAAVFHGAPSVGIEGALDLYVPGPVLLSIAVRRYGAADPIAAAASVAVPSVPQVTVPVDLRDQRYRGWPVVHPVAAALDLAALGDARAQQVLAEWRPDGEAVWHEQ